MYAVSIYLPNFKADIFQLKSALYYGNHLTQILSPLTPYSVSLVKRLQIYNLILTFQMFIKKNETF